MEKYSKFIELTNEVDKVEIINVEHIVRITSDRNGFVIITTNGTIRPKQTLEEVISMLPSCVKLSDIN